MDEATLTKLVGEQTAAWTPEQRNALLHTLNRESRRLRAAKQYDTPGKLAQALDPSIVQTPAMQAIDDLFVDALTTPNARKGVTIAPQQGKSTRLAVYGVVDALLDNPDRRIVVSSYSEALARTHVRAARDIIKAHGSNARDPLTGAKLPDKLGIAISDGNASAASWTIQGHRGGCYAVGVGGSLTGRACDLLIIDDPHKGMAEADSAVERHNVLTWWESVAQTRLAPGAPVFVIQCMTGDTPVLMSDGTEKPLRDVQPGDEVATYENNSLSTAVVKNWANQGPDDIYEIKLKSGRTVKANARHPFLTIEDGKEVWRRTDELHSQSRILTATGENGEGSSAQPTGAADPSFVKGSARPTTTRSVGQTGTGLRRSTLNLDEQRISNTDTSSDRGSTRRCLKLKAETALSAGSHPLTETPAPTGETNCALTTTTKQAASEACSATTATSQSVTGNRPRPCLRQLDTYEITPDEVVSVAPCGVEEVFDLQIERTENFIANGLVSHNTRWHEKDLLGYLLELDEAKPEESREWQVLNIPAIAEAGVPDALGREPGTPLESTRGHTLDDWLRIKEQVGPRVWSALYQGQPTPGEGGLFSQDWFDRYRLPALPEHGIAARVVSVDPAETGKRDEAGVVALAVSNDSRVMVTDDRSGRMQSDQWSRAAVKLALEVGAHELVFEAFTTGPTYERVIQQAWQQLRLDARALRQAGGDVADAAIAISQRDDPPSNAFAAAQEVQGLDVPDQVDPPFRITPWRAKGDKTARATGTRQAASTGRLRMVGSFPALEGQACHWQQGQASPDRLDALVNGFERCVEIVGRESVIAVPGSVEAPVAAAGFSWGAIPTGL